jgi:hypothetical protein
MRQILNLRKAKQEEKESHRFRGIEANCNISKIHNVTHKKFKKQNALPKSVNFLLGK